MEPEPSLMDPLPILIDAPEEASGVGLGVGLGVASPGLHKLLYQFGSSVNCKPGFGWVLNQTECQL